MLKTSEKQFRPIYLLFGFLVCATAAAANPLSVLRSDTHKVASSTVHVTKKIIQAPVRAVQVVKNAF